MEKGSDFVPKHGIEEEKKEVARMVFDIDSWKSLTGRTPERLEEETGIDKNELFPEGKDVLYVGDPWQKMGIELDNPHLFLIDYEFGETVSFVDNRDRFLINFLGDAEEKSADGGDADNFGIFGDLYFQIDGKLSISFLSEEERAWFLYFKDLIREAQKSSLKAKFLGEHGPLHDQSSQCVWCEAYGAAAKAWGAAREQIEAVNRQEKDSQEDLFSDFRKETWYLCVEGERGFQDLRDWEVVIRPKLEEYRVKMEQAGVFGETVQDGEKKLRKQLIDSIRLKKKPEEAHVVQAVFPQLPFADSSFDRVVASWSISAHVFAVLDKAGFKASWDEIFRVLRDGGKAYIFPLWYSPPDKDDFVGSLNDFCKETGMSWYVLDQVGKEIDYDDSQLVETLVLEK